VQLLAAGDQERLLRESLGSWTSPEVGARVRAVLEK